jgi:hypothetical protein
LSATGDRWFESISLQERVRCELKPQTTGPSTADLNVVAGHGRLLACRELGWTEVPTLRLDHLTAAQARAFMIADNRLTEIAAWDDRLLAQQLKDLCLLGLDFSIEVTGFEIGEIDLRIASLEDMPDTDDPADAVPELPAGLCQVYVLGTRNGCSLPRRTQTVEESNLAVFPAIVV